MRNGKGTWYIDQVFYAARAARYRHAPWDEGTGPRTTQQRATWKARISTRSPRFVSNATEVTRGRTAKYHPGFTKHVFVFAPKRFYQTLTVFAPQSRHRSDSRTYRCTTPPEVTRGRTAEIPRPPSRPDANREANAPGPRRDTKRGKSRNNVPACKRPR